MPGPTPFTTPNDSLIRSCTATQLRNKGSIGYNGTHQLHPKTAYFPSTIITPSNTPIARLTPLTTSKRHPISRFATIHFADRQTDRTTDRPTDGRGECFVPRALTLRERRANNNYKQNLLFAVKCLMPTTLSSDTGNQLITGARECRPVLTATHHSNGRFCDFILFSARPLGVRPLNRSSRKMA